MNTKMYPCLWFDGRAKEAALFYGSVFNHMTLIDDTPLVVCFEIEGMRIMGLNGGPMFNINPSISFFVTCETPEETERYYHTLMEGGNAMMPLDSYPWAEKYAWVIDKFGMTWQLMLGKLQTGEPKIVPCFLFTNAQYGKAQQAIQYYTSLFPDSKINELQLYQSGEPQPEGNLKFGRFTLNNLLLAAMEGSGNPDFNFNEGVSFVVECDTQEEIDTYWNTLTEGGEESMCGWLKDQFGVSWQIVPSILGKLMTDPDKGPRVMQAFLKMKKFDIETLLNV